MATSQQAPTPTPWRSGSGGPPGEGTPPCQRESYVRGNGRKTENDTAKRKWVPYGDAEVLPRCIIYIIIQADGDRKGASNRELQKAFDIPERLDFSLCGEKASKT